VAQSQGVTKFMGDDRLEIVLARLHGGGVVAAEPVPALHEGNLTGRLRAAEHPLGGAVEATSAGPGQGAAFTARLPLKEEQPALTEFPAAALKAAAAPLRILIVEDNRDAADSLRMLPELLGHRVAVAYSGPAGVRLARQGRPDVVLCDIGLPGLYGYGVAGELRHDPTTGGAPHRRHGLRAGQRPAPGPGGRARQPSSSR
jgi:CheY-like chemotaxis protein